MGAKPPFLSSELELRHRLNLFLFLSTPDQIWFAMVWIVPSSLFSLVDPLPRPPCVSPDFWVVSTQALPFSPLVSLFRCWRRLCLPPWTFVPWALIVSCWLYSPLYSYLLGHVRFHCTFYDAVNLAQINLFCFCCDA